MKKLMTAAFSAALAAMICAPQVASSVCAEEDVVLEQSVEETSASAAQAEASKAVRVPLNKEGTVEAVMDPETRVVTISGNGVLDAKMWSEVSSAPEGTYPFLLNYPKGSDPDERPNAYAEKLVWEEGVLLPADCSELFDRFAGEIEFPEQLNTSHVTNMYAMFRGANKANPDVSRWDVSNVKNFTEMFFDAKSADPDVSQWDVSSASGFDYMFAGSGCENPDVSGWRMPGDGGKDKAFSFQYMFGGLKNANPDTAKWGVNAIVYGLGTMFNGTSVTNINICGWKIDENWPGRSWTIPIEFDRLPKLEVFEFDEIPGQRLKGREREAKLEGFRSQTFPNPYRVETFDAEGNVIATKDLKAGETFPYETSTHYRITIDRAAMPKGLVTFDDGRIRFYLDNGEVLCNAWKNDNGNTYFFDQDGYAVKGLYEDGALYYFDEVTGVQLKDAWKTVGDNTYYFNQYGPAYKGLRELGGQLYYFDPNTGAQLKDSWKTIGKKTYYFNAWGPAYKGLRKLGNQFYYFDPATAVQFKNGWKTVGNKTYYFNPWGPAYKGLRTIHGVTYFFDQKDAYQYKKSWKTIGNKTYYLNDYGVAVKGLVKLGAFYYGFSPEGVQYKNGWYKIGAKTYYFNKYGVMKGSK